MTSYHTQPDAPKSSSFIRLILLSAAGLAVLLVLAFAIAGSLGGGGGVNVTSEPAGASVLVNGHVAGATPVSIKGLSNGSYTIRLEKAEFAPVSLRVEVSSGVPATVREKLQPVARGTLVVNIKPSDAEVLIDGELAGHTPLKLDGIEIGPHELTVRKTNFSSYSRRIEIAAGEISKFEDIELFDRVLEHLESQIKNEPQRVGHYIDLGHYYFVNDRFQDAAETYALGTITANTSLDFDGPGFPGKSKMTAEEIELQQRLRREDQSRLPKEIDKHRSFPKKDTKAFRLAMAEATDRGARKDVKSWTRTKIAAQEKLAGGNIEQAIAIYKEHIAAAPKSPELPTAYLALIEALCRTGDEAKITAQVDEFFKLYEQQKDGQSLRAAGKILNGYADRIKSKDARTHIQQLAEKSLRAGLALPCDSEGKSDSLFELALSVLDQGRANDAIPIFRESIDSTRAISKQEDRELRLADALRKSGDRAGAIKVYDKLKASERPNVRESANYGMIVLKQNESKP
ncbi:MAG: PEGA domain-containing protein [Planctomycetota bacterium]